MPKVNGSAGTEVVVEPDAHLFVAFLVLAGETGHEAVEAVDKAIEAAASFSALLLASLRAFGPERGSAYAELPKWRRNARPPSCLDLVTLSRKEMAEHPKFSLGSDFPSALPNSLRPPQLENV